MESEDEFGFAHGGHELRRGALTLALSRWERGIRLALATGRNASPSPRGRGFG